MRIFTNKKIQSTEETGEEDKQATLPLTAPPPQIKKWSQAFLELQSKVMRMEEIWQEKWEIVQKENKSLKGRISQLETEAQK